MKYFFLLLVVCGLMSCASPADQLADFDLMSEGIPLKIKAPENAVVKKKDMGIFKDITVRSGEDFYLQITAATALNNNIKERKKEELETIKELNVFSKVLKEDDRGFIFEKKKGDKMSYDFRSVKIVGETEYLFQSGLIGNFTLEDVELMYDAVK